MLCELNSFKMNIRKMNLSDLIDGQCRIECVLCNFKLTVEFYRHSLYCCVFLSIFTFLVLLRYLVGASNSYIRATG